MPVLGRTAPSESSSADRLGHIEAPQGEATREAEHNASCERPDEENPRRDGLDEALFPAERLSDL